MTWLVYAVLISFTAAAFSEANRIFKMDGFRLNFWRSLVAVVLVFPATLFVEWPMFGWFYAAVLFNGIALIIASTLKFNAAAKHNGRVASLFMPVKVFFAFFLWLAISKQALADQMANPWQFAGIMGTFVLAAGALFLMRRNDVGWQAFLYVAPVGVLFAVTDVVVKLLSEGQDPLEMSVIYVFLSFLVAMVLSGLFLIVRHSPDKELLPPKMFRAAFIIGILGAVTFTLFLLGVIHAPNPAYVTAVAMLSPVWLMFYHKLRGIKDDASPFAGFLLVASAITLAVLTT